VNYEQKYTELKAKFEELEEMNRNQIDETLQTVIFPFVVDRIENS